MRRKRLAPFLLTSLIVLVDQLTKAVIVRTLEPIYDGGRVIEVFGEVVRIIHARNPGIAFSIGDTLPGPLRGFLFVIIPIVAMAGIAIYAWKSDEFTGLQRWFVAGVLGGGIGNIIDRIFRPAGVVDFIDVKFYGLFGLERWPTFNVADSSVVVCGILLVLSMFIERSET
ncbi:MAG: signal peptidase II [Spirochaetaceae bacterium]